MTQESLINKMEELLLSDKPFIEKLINKAIESKCMDIDGAEENYRLPKNLLSAIYKEMSRQYAPLSGDKKEKQLIEKIYTHL